MPGISGQPSPKPNDIQSPVPGNSQLDAFMASQGAAAKSAGAAMAKASPPDNAGGGGSQLDSFMSQQSGAAAQPQDSNGAAPSVLGQTLDAAGRVLDYPGGFMRAGLANAFSMATGHGVVATPEDLRQAAVGKGPNMAEYLKRLGLDEGQSLTLPGVGKVTQRGVEGLALDIATDPLTLVARTMKSIPYLKTLIEAPGAATEALGQAVYRSAITAKDSEQAAKAGQALVEAGAPIAGETDLAQKIQQTAQTMGGLRQGLYDRFTQLGGKVDVTDSTFKNANGVLAKLKENPTLEPLAAQLEDMLNKYQGQGFIPIDRMSDWKSQLYDSLPANAFSGAKIKNPAKLFKAALAQDFKNAIVDSGNKVEAGLGDAINQINDKWGALLNAKPVSGPMSGSLGKSIDGAALVVGGIPGLVKKKAFELATGPAGKTVVGNALMEAGRAHAMNSLTLSNAALRESESPETEPQQ